MKFTKGNRFWYNLHHDPLTFRDSPLSDPPCYRYDKPLTLPESLLFIIVILCIVAAAISDRGGIQWVQSKIL